MNPTAAELAGLLAAESPAPDAAVSPPGGWLFEELAARDQATTVAHLHAGRRRAAGQPGTESRRDDAWLAAELKRRDDGTADLLRRSIQDRLARIEDIGSRWSPRT